jgi:prepilin peptidase CpaA
MHEQIIWGSFLTFLTAASVSDVRSFRLPNWLMLLGFVAGVSLSGAFAGVEGAKLSLLGMLTGLLPVFVLAAMRFTSMGDAKFMGAIGSFVGPEGALMTMLYGAVAGGVLSVVLWFTAKPDAERKKIKAPYGLALAVGAVVAALRCGFAGGVA